MMDLISVIVPVYKVEEYLDRCVESIVNQTYRNLEIILVDDGSPDRCPEMCDAWAEKDSRIKVIHKENGGLSDARNAGMAVATGEYIGFVDSDDWIEPPMYEQMYRYLKETSSDLASCGALRVWEDRTPSKEMLHFSGNHCLDHVNAMKALIESTFLIQTVWNKLYKRALICDIPFEKGKIHEDEFWSWQAIARASRVAILEESFYNYAQRSGSIMGDGYTGKPMLIIDAKLRRHNYISRNLPELQDIDTIHLLYTCYFQGTQILKYEKRPQSQEYMHSLVKTAHACKIGLAYWNRLSFLRKVRLFTIRNWLPLVCRLDILLGKA